MSNRILEGLTSIAKSSVTGIDYFARYPAKVIAQSSDYMTVDIQPDNPNIPGMQAIPIRNGLVGVTQQIKAGTYVHVGWEEGNPTKAYVATWFNEIVTGITIADSAQDTISLGNGTIKLSSGSASIQIDSTSVTLAFGTTSIEVNASSVVVKASGTTVINASVSSLALGLAGILPLLTLGSFDSFGIPVTQNPAATATIVMGG